MSVADRRITAADRRRLFISDLDGTLLLPDRTLGQRTHQTLRRFMDQGGLFTIATGRSAASTASLLGELTLSAPAITHNGALTVELSTREILAAVPLAGATAARVFRHALAQGLAPGAYALAPELPGQTLLLHGPRPNPPTQSYLESLRQLLPVSEDDGHQLATRQALSLILLDERPHLERFLADVAELAPGLSVSLGASAYTPALGVAELQAGGANKALAAVELARSLGLEPEDLVAFGDNMNDLPLLLAAGASFCPPDAVAEVLALVPQRIAAPAEEGVAQHLELLLDQVPPELPLAAAAGPGQEPS